MTTVASESAIAPASGRAGPCFALRIAGLGAALPKRRVTNADLARRLDTSDEWITRRTGIGARRVAGPGETTVGLAADASRAALRAAGLDATAVDLILVATSTPDSACPSTAARLAAELATPAGGFDVNGACAGFAHAVLTAGALLANPATSTVLVVGAERYLSIIDPADRGTAILFGDGAGAAVVTRPLVEPTPQGGAFARDAAVSNGAAGAGVPGILGADVGGDPTGVGVIEVPSGQAHLRMDGPELFRRATRALVASGNAALDQAGATGADVDLYVPHQANARIMTAAADRLGIAPDRVVIDLAERANTSAASIPLALEAAQRSGALRPGMRVLVSGVGAGLAWCTLYLRWGP